MPLRVTDAEAPRIDERRRPRNGAPGVVRLGAA